MKTFLDAVEQGLQQAPELPVAISFPTEAEWNRFSAALDASVSTATANERGVVFENHSPMSVFGTGAVVGGAAIAAAIVLPSLMQHRLDASETTVQESLERIASVQRTIKQGAYIDTDRDGVGEYAYFGEITGAVPIRGGAAKIGRSPLPAEFANLANGVVQYSGYCFRLDLADRTGVPLAEKHGGGAPSGVDADGAELGYVVYCWPMQMGASGRRVFVLDETGTVFASENDRGEQGYSGLHRAPRGDAAFLEGGTARDRGTRSVRRGRDGGLWIREN